MMNFVCVLILVLPFLFLACDQPQQSLRQPREEPELPDSVLWALVDESLRDTYAVSDRPSNGFVPDERSAIRIAEAVSSALYGEEQTAQERPFRARLKDDIWTVIGTVGDPGHPGGAAVIQIDKNDGRILFAVHQQ